MSKVIYELVQDALQPVYCQGLDVDVPALPLDGDSLAAECARLGKEIVQLIGEGNGVPGGMARFTPTFDRVSQELSGVRAEFE